MTVAEVLDEPVLIHIDEDIVHHCAGDPEVGCLTEDDCIAAGTTGPCEGEAPQMRADVRVADGGGRHHAGCDRRAARRAAPGAGPADRTERGGLARDLSRRAAAVPVFDCGRMPLRGWSADPISHDAPREDTSYRVEVRCSADTSCSASAVVDVDVDCPGTVAGPFAEPILAESKTVFRWTTPFEYDPSTGDLAGVSGYAGSLSSGSGDSFTVEAVPPAGEGLYLVLRLTGDLCNERGPWTSGGPSEIGGPGSCDEGGFP